MVCGADDAEGGGNDGGREGRECPARDSRGQWEEVMHETVTGLTRRRSKSRVRQRMARPKAGRGICCLHIRTVLHAMKVAVMANVVASALTARLRMKYKVGDSRDLVKI